MTTPSDSRPKRRDGASKIGVEEFLRSARLAGIIDETSYRRLITHFVNVSAAKAPAPQSPAVTTPVAASRVSSLPTRPAREAEAVQRRAALLESQLRRIELDEGSPPRVRGRAKALHQRARDAVGTDELPRILAEATTFIDGAKRSRKVPPERRLEPRPPKGPGPLRSALATARASAADAWKHLSADFAANTLTYIGVLLAVVVIFVFFAFGYVGDVVAIPNLRPVVELGVPLFFLGVAWLLRNRTGLPAAASAVGLIGAVTLPVMLSASFQDGSVFPPDVGGSARWPLYGAVGIVTAVIYLWLSTRARIYSYLVVPMLWMAAGALGLFWQNGISGPQLFTVLGAIGVSLLAATAGRETAIGKRLAVPTARAGVLAAPFVLIVALVFAYNDAVASGVADPGIGELAYPGIVAAVLTTVILAFASGTGYAWEGIPERTRVALLAALRTSAYLTLAGAWLLTAGLGVPVGWLGAGLVAYAIAVIVIDRTVGGTGPAVVWISRIAGAVGLIVALADPVPALCVWSAAAVAAGMRAASPSARRITADFVPIATTGLPWLLELWTPALVAVAIAAGRVFPNEAAPWVLAVAATGAAATRFLPRSLRQLRSYATGPALLLIALGAIRTVAVWSELRWPAAYLVEAGLVFLLLAGAATLVMVPWWIRLPVVAGLATAGAGWTIGGLAEAGPWGSAMVATVTTATIGTALLSVSLVPRWRRFAYAHGLLGHLYLFAALGIGAVFEETAIIALGAVFATHAIEAVLAERDQAPFVSDLATLTGSAGLVRAAPAAVAAVVLIPTTVLVGRQVPFVASDVSRLSLVFAVLSWAYAAAAALRWRRIRVVLITLSYWLAAAALAIAVPSRPLLVLSAASGAGVTLWLAAGLNAPYTSAVSWILAGSAFLLGLSEAGVAAGDLQFWLLGLSIVVLVSASTVNLVTGGRPGVRSRWLRPPIGLAMLSMAATLAVAVADGRALGLQASIAAAAIAWFGWCTRFGGVSFLVGGLIGATYVDVVSRWVSPFDEPVLLLPYAFALLGAGLAMPSRRAWRPLTDAFPGTLLAGLATIVLAASLAVGTADLAPVLAWSAAWLAIVFVVRGEDPWLYAGLTSLVAAGWIAGPGWAAAASLTASAGFAGLAEMRRDRPSGRVLPWVSVALLGGGYGAVVAWQSWTPRVFVVVSIALGAALAGTALVMSLVLDRRAHLRRWTGPSLALGQTTLLAAALVAGVEFDRPATAAALSAIVFIEALLVGVVATVRLRPELAWASAVLGACSAWLLAEAAARDAQTSVVGAVVLAALLTSGWGILFSARPNVLRLRLWTRPLLALAAGVSVVAVALAFAELPERSAAFATAAMLTWHAAVVGTAATIRLDRLSVWTASALAAGAYGFWLRAAEPGAAESVAVLVATAALSGVVGARLTVRKPSFDPARLWIGSLNVWAGLAAVAAIGVSFEALPARTASTTAAVVSLGAAAVLLIHARAERAAPWLRESSAAALVMSAAFFLAAIDPDAALFTAAILCVAGAGMAASIIGARVEGAWRHPTLVVSGGFVAVALAAATWTQGPASATTGYVLALAGAALAGYGIVEPDLRAVEAAIVTWAISALILLDSRISLGLHSVVLTISVATLAALDLESHRLRTLGREVPGWTRTLEWVFMAAPLTLAAVHTLSDLAYAVLLAAEAVALLTWGIFTQVRRRAFVGIGGLVAAIALAVVIPVIEGVRQGFAAGTWLIAGAIAAVALIAAGSIIEKRRERIGRRLTRVIDIVEHWR